MAPRYVSFGAAPTSRGQVVCYTWGPGTAGDDEELEDLAGDGDDQALRELAWRRAQASPNSSLPHAVRSAWCAGFRL